MKNPRPTFPLPPRELRKERLRAFFLSKQVWIPFLLLLVAGLVARTPAWALVPLLALALFVLALVWEARSHRLLAAITRRIIARSNREQDAALVGRVRGFTEAGEDGYAVTLGKFLEAKQRLEAALHGGGKPPTPGGEELEKRVDAIAFGVAGEFDAVLAIEKQIRALEPEPGRREELRLFRARQKIHLTRVIEAYKTVKQALAALVLIVRHTPTEAPEAAPSEPGANELDAAIARLREETRIAVDGGAREV